jgi:hypothetical protein
MAGYHAIVWKGGRAGSDGLFVTEASDREILAALESLGARPSGNLPIESWEERKHSENPAPDMAIGGPPVEVLVRLPRRRDPVPLTSLLTDSAGRGLDMRFGGNAANIPVWKSGCVACLYSCPGSKIGNARYTERDFAKGATRFRVKPGALPPDGTRVRIVLRLSP